MNSINSLQSHASYLAFCIPNGILVILMKIITWDENLETVDGPMAVASWLAGWRAEWIKEGRGSEVTDASIHRYH